MEGYIQIGFSLLFNRIWDFWLETDDISLLRNNNSMQISELEQNILAQTTLPMFYLQTKVNNLPFLDQTTSDAPQNQFIPFPPNTPGGFNSKASMEAPAI